MSWEHEMARELRSRDNRQGTTWFSGEVISPIKTTDEHGRATYHGPLIISCFDGQVMLREAQLQMLAGVPQAAGEPRLHDGMTVALCGDPFSGDPGALRALILGVVQDAV